MGTQLYVANLPDAPSALALRAHFSVCGVVSDVQIVPDRHSGRGRGCALVRMSSAAEAKRALSELNGSTFAGQRLLVEAAPDDAADRRAAANRGKSPSDENRPSTRITMQYREPANMTYELDCSGVTIVVRLFFPSETGQCRVAVQARGEADAASVTTDAASRLEAFRSVARACKENGGPTKLTTLDWDAVEKALREVRAL